MNLCDIEEVASVLVSKEDEISQKVDIQLRDPDKEVRKDKFLLSNPMGTQRVSKTGRY